MSAPAMKPLFLAESTTMPRGRSIEISSSRESSSRRTWLESTLVEVPGLSAVSQRMPSASREICQAEAEVSVLLTFSPCGAGSGRGRALLVRFHVEIAHERAMIRIPHVRHAEIGHLDSLAHQDEVELDARHARR